MLAETRASLKNRSARPGRSARSECKNFNATGTLSTRCWASYTAPIPPSPIRRVMRYLSRTSVFASRTMALAPAQAHPVIPGVFLGCNAESAAAAAPGNVVHMRHGVFVPSQHEQQIAEAIQIHQNVAAHRHRDRK